ncbi:hypothetical protein NDI44_28340 [Trichocoleus sp. DQ-A3]|uniref:hypothetical protein n=1 Tax=Coleofasciculus sp. FACHB-125 TaxID=2692784 RepID=UPI001681F811|nr:hypothetical protein [Coleofasciculus sp. FACHB-125]MBD1903687.1 hypothetical protein [Coleofasciculus sp. FACHB-125]
MNILIQTFTNSLELQPPSQAQSHPPSSSTTLGFSKEVTILGNLNLALQIEKVWRTFKRFDNSWLL